MKLSELKKSLQNLQSVNFQLPDGKLVPAHFHVTELGKITKDYIDCGGTVRHESVASMQLWEAEDYDHRLEPSKLIRIIDLSQEKLNIDDLDVEVEYQSATIGKYGLRFDGSQFILTAKQTDCLAKDNCGIPVVNLSEMTQSNCAPGSGCC